MGNAVIVKQGSILFNGREVNIHGSAQYDVQGDVFTHIQMSHGPQPFGRFVYMDRGQPDSLLPPGMKPMVHLCAERLTATEGPFPTSFMVDNSQGKTIACFGEPEDQGHLVCPFASKGIVLVGMEGCANEISIAYGGEPTEQPASIIVGPLAGVLSTIPNSLREDIAVILFFETAIISRPNGYFLTMSQDMKRWPPIPLNLMSLILQAYGYIPEDAPEPMLFQKEMDDQSLMVLRAEREQQGMYRMVQVAHITKESKLL